MSTACVPFTWLPTTVDSLEPTRIVSIIAGVLHGFFWIQFFVYSSLRQRNMMWIFAYLITDLLLLCRFFVLYEIRVSGTCLFKTSRDILCYFEASSKFYLNTVQSYLILSFNVCRYLQIAAGRNIYTEKPRLILLAHGLIYSLPMVNLVVQFFTTWAQLWRRRGGSCDIQYSSTAVQIFNVFVTFLFPIVTNLIILALDIRYVSSVRGVCSEQIIHLRRKRQRILLCQTVSFYSIWLLLWSPDIATFQFFNVNSEPALFTSLLSYVGIALDPIIVAILDVRFLKPWRTAWKKCKRHRRIGVLPGSAFITQVVPRRVDS